MTTRGYDGKVLFDDRDVHGVGTLNYVSCSSSKFI